MKSGEYGTMDDSVKSYLAKKEEEEKKTADLANIVTNYAMEHSFSFSRVMESIEIVKEAFQQAAIINKGWIKSA